jgi:hypothetical protein
MGLRVARPLPSLPGLGFLFSTLRSLAQENHTSKLKDSGHVGAGY